MSLILTYYVLFPLYSLILDCEFRITGRLSLRRYLALGIRYILLQEDLFYFCQVHRVPENILNWTLRSPHQPWTDCVLFYLEPRLRQIHLSPISFYIMRFPTTPLVRLPIRGIMKPGIFFKAMWPLNFFLSHKLAIKTKALDHYRMSGTSMYPRFSTHFPLRICDITIFDLGGFLLHLQAVICL